MSTTYTETLRDQQAQAHRDVSTRYDKLAVRYEATVQIRSRQRLALNPRLKRPGDVARPPDGWLRRA
jgi:hypothetical protein